MTYEQAAADRHKPMPVDAVGRIIAINGAQALVQLQHPELKIGVENYKTPEIGAILKIETDSSITLGMVSAMSVPVPEQDGIQTELWLAEIELVGELRLNSAGQVDQFFRGVSVYPALSDPVYMASQAELEQTFLLDPDVSIEVGRLHQDPDIPACVNVDELLGKHFAILGTTGTGKSCTVALLLRKIIQKNPNGHVVLLDPHGEYSHCFGDQSERITMDNLYLPFWLLTFEELVEVVIGEDQGKDQEIDILAELIPLAKANYSKQGKPGSAARTRRVLNQAAGFTVDTPTPYRMSDLQHYIDERMGRLENKKDLGPYRYLKSRFEALTQDSRYAFMFGSLSVHDTMVEILGRIFRIPVQGRPLSILELVGIPSEIVNVTVSVIARMAFDFALWGEGRVPVTLVCEEAHRYVPAKEDMGFAPTKRALARIAKEGRKYGASLCIITQRPSELDPTIVSQCNTIFSLRMSNERDQKIIASAVSDAAASMLEFLPSLGVGEAIAFGEGVTLPVRVRFSRLPPHALPRSQTARFTTAWKEGDGDQAFLQDVVNRWRSSTRPEAGEEEQQDLEMEQMMAAEVASPASHQPVAHQRPVAPAQSASASTPIRRSLLQDETPPAPAGFPQRAMTEAGARQPRSVAPSPARTATPVRAKTSNALRSLLRK